MADKDESLMDKIRTYSPRSAKRVEESEEETRKYGEEVAKDIKAGKYGSAALNTAKGIGSAANTLLAETPKAALHAFAQRVNFGEKPSKEQRDEMKRETRGMKKGGAVKSASSRADGCAMRGKTRGKIV